MEPLHSARARRNTRLHNTRLTNADLGSDAINGSTQVQGADLSAANIQGTRFEGAVYDTDTIFPEAFQPSEHDMVREP